MTTIGEFRCPHGHGPNDGRYEGVWAAPFSTCTCCGVSFPYIDSASYTWGKAGGKSWGSSWTKDLCSACGGHYVQWGDKDDETWETRS